MAVPGGDIEIEVTADADNVVPTVRRVLRMAARMSASQGKRIAAAMSKSVNSMSTKLASMGDIAGKSIRPLYAVIGGLIPLLTSASSALAGALTAIVGSLARASTSGLALAGIFGSLIQAAVVGKIAFKGFGDAVKGDEEALKKLSPAARAAAMAVSGLKDEAKAIQTAVQQRVFKNLEGPISNLGKTLMPMLKNQFAAMGGQINFLLKDLLRFANSAKGVNLFRNAISGTTGVFAVLRKAAVPLLAGIMRLYTALLPAAERFAGVIVGGAKSFNGWTKGAGFAKMIDDYMIKAAASMSIAWSLVKNLGRALWNVFNATATEGDGLLKTLSDVVGKFADWAGTVAGADSIAKWAQQGATAMTTLGRIIGSMGGILSALFNPAIFNGFLNIIETITPTIKTVFGVLQTAFMPVIEQIGSSMSEFAPKVSKLFVALSPLLKGLGAVIKNIIKQTFQVLGVVLDVITPIVAIISKVLGPVIEKLAPIIATVLLGFGSFGATLVRLVPLVGRFIAPLVKLAGWLLSKIGPAVKFLGRIIGSVFMGIGRIIGSVMGTVFRLIGKTFNGIRSVISTVLRVISGIIRAVFNVYKTIITTVMNVIRGVIVRVWNGIRSVISGAVNKIKGVINGLSSVVGKVKSIFTSAWNGAKNATTAGVNKVMGFIKDIPGKVTALGSRMLSAGKNVGKKIIDGLLNGLRGAGGMVSNLGQSIKNAINNALRLPFTIRGPGPLPDFTIPRFAKGGLTPGGPIIAGENGPELIEPPKGWRVHTAGQTRNMAGSGTAAGMPKTMVLRIGGRDFVAYVSELADHRVEAAASLGGAY